MKKLTITALLAFLTLGLNAQVQVRLTGSLTNAFEGGLSVENIASGWDDGQNSMLGFGWELILGKVGFGTEMSAKFTRTDTRVWILDFQTTALATYHLFGVKSFIDPFGQVGLGAAGAVDLTNGVDKTGYQDLSGIALGLFPVAGFGVSLDFDGLLVGAKILYHPTVWGVPAAPISDYPLSRFQFGVFAGFGIGDHHQSSHHGKKEECEEEED